MEEYVGYAFLAVMGLVLALLIRSITRMYERLWNSNKNQGQNPEEQAAILLDAINEANKLREDRLRKAKAKQISVSEREESPGLEESGSGSGLSQAPDSLEAKVEALWQQYKELGGE